MNLHEPAQRHLRATCGKARSRSVLATSAVAAVIRCSISHWQRHDLVANHASISHRVRWSRHGHRLRGGQPYVEPEPGYPSPAIARQQRIHDRPNGLRQVHGAGAPNRMLEVVSRTPR